jgi:BirA family biotin operon repressor/biotin-[acetyl-CoA-carboxylase] ligase
MNELVYDENKIRARLNGKGVNIRLFVFRELDSTNSFAKRLAESDVSKTPAVIIANGQTQGRGTRGRSFISESGRGIYMSILFYPEKKLSPADITVFSAVKTAQSIEAVAPLEVKIKWVNDLYVSEKKLSGILTEGKITDSKLDYAIMGVGINTHGCAFPEEISDIATSIEKECGVSLDREELIFEIVNRFFSCQDEMGTNKIATEYKKRSLILGKEVKVLANGEEFFAKAVDILDTGAVLLEKTDGELIKLQSGDVSLILNR